MLPLLENGFTAVSFYREELENVCQVMPIGILKFCLEYVASPVDHIRGLFESIRRNFKDLRSAGTLKTLTEVYDFRNRYVAHQERELKDIQETRTALKQWISLIAMLNAKCS